LYFNLKIEHKQVLLHYSIPPFTLLIIYPLCVNFALHEKKDVLFRDKFHGAS
jgi:hypothetical protein